MTELLADELDTYEKNKKELLGRAAQKYVLIKDSEVVDVFETPIDAIRRGYELYGNVPFLVKEIREVDKPLEFTSHLLGV
jgi:hypothetical protein